MRRMILLALGLGMLAAVVGCDHFAGVCDCEGPGGGCGCGVAPAGALQAEAQTPYGVEVAPTGLQTETIEKAPRMLGNGPPMK